MATPYRSSQLSEMLNMNSALHAEAYVGEALEQIDLGLEVSRPEHKSNQNILFQNEPNPFSASTTIRFQLEHSGQASIRIYDLSGHLLHKVIGQYESGMNEIQISNIDLGIKDGVTICQLQSNGFVAVQRMVVIR